MSNQLFQPAAPVPLVQAVSVNSRMTSREIAELTEKQHLHVLRDIRDLIDRGAITESSFGLSDYKDGSGKKNPMYTLDFEATMTLITGYDAKRRSMVIKRWLALETGEAEPAIPTPKKKTFTESQTRKEAAHIIAADMMVGRLLGTSVPMAKAIAVENARRLTGVDYGPFLPPAQVEEVPVGVRKLSELSGIPERKISVMLIERELASRDDAGNLLLTDKAKSLSAGSMEPFKSRSSNHSDYQCKWFPSVVVPLLEGGHA